MASSVVVSTAPLRDLVSRLGTATDASIEAVVSPILSAATTLRDSIGAVPWYQGLTSDQLIDDEAVNERETQKLALTDAIDRLVAASSLADKKTALIYLQSTISVSEAFYSQQDGWSAFLDTISQALATLEQNVILPLAGGLGAGLASTVSAFVKKAWPVLLGVVALLVVLVYLKGKK